MRQRRFAESYQTAKNDVKQRFGSGIYSYAGEMTRRSAHKIARGLARKAAGRPGRAQ